MHLRSVSSRNPRQTESNLPAPRKELVARLGDCLERLQKLIATPYAGASSLDCWPAVDELNRLATAVGQLGQAIKITKVDFEHLDAVMCHLDRRYPKLGLLAFFDGLIRKLESIPVGPVTRINQRLAAGVDSNSEKQLLAIRDLLTSLEWKVEAKAGTWKALGPLLDAGTSRRSVRYRLQALPALRTRHQTKPRPCELGKDGRWIRSWCSPTACAQFSKGALSKVRSQKVTAKQTSANCARVGCKYGLPCVVIDR